MPRIDYAELERKIATMSVRSPLYKALKRSLKQRGWWKNRVRGKYARANARQS